MTALASRDTQIKEMAETLEFLEMKVKKLEQLLRLKDSRIQSLSAKLQAVGGMPAE